MKASATRLSQNEMVIVSDRSIGGAASSTYDRENVIASEFEVYWNLQALA